MPKGPQGQKRPTDVIGATVEVEDKATSILYRDPAASILFGVALFLVVLNMAAAFSRHIALIEVSLVLTGAFAAVGAAFGLVRGLRSGRAIRRRSV